MREKKYLMVDTESKTPLADAIRYEVFNNRVNYAVIVTGRTQMRKSTTALAETVELDPHFDIDKDFAIIKTDEMITTVSRTGKRGSTKFLDEIGTGLDHHLWQNFFVRAFGWIMQTSGFEGKIYMCTVPYDDLVTKDILKFFNLKIEIVGKDEDRCFVIAKVMTLEYDSDSKDVIKKYPRDSRTGQPIKLFRISYRKIKDSGLLDVYFERANAMKKGLQYDLMAEAEQIQRKQAGRSFNLDFYVDEIAKDPGTYMVNWHNMDIFSTTKIMNKFHVGMTRARQIQSEATEKLLVQPGENQSDGQDQPAQNPADQEGQKPDS